MKNNKGITIIVLIITVIVMLILAAVSINYALGDNGIFEGTRKSEYMNYVQILDDTIKAYTIKSNDPYSSSKKTISDLINEGVLIKIVLEDNKSIYYVSDTGLRILELDNKLENKTKLEETFEGDSDWAETRFKKVEDLQKYGVYVVDNDFNAAFLYKNKIYGKLYNFGTAYLADDGSNYNGKLVNIYPKLITESEQEVVMLIDRTVSMALSIDADESSENVPIVYSNSGQIDYEIGYTKTRWYEAVKAMDSFINTYLAQGTTKKKLTIYTYCGADSSSLNVECLGTFTQMSPAKKSYANIFSQNQYKTMLENIDKTYKESGTYSVSQTYGLSTNYFSTSNGKYLINCRCINSQYSSLFSGNAPSLGYGTCTPNAMKTVYEYVLGKVSSNIPMDVIIMTDGETNTYVDLNSDKTLTGYYAGLIKDLEIKNHNTGIYAVGFSKDASAFKNDFTHNGINNIGDDNYFSAESAGALTESFNNILKSVDQGSSSIITDGEINSTYVNVTEIKVEVYDSAQKESTVKTYDYINNGTYDLSEIYDGSKVDLTTVYDKIDSDSSITIDYDKIDVTIYYYGDNK